MHSAIDKIRIGTLLPRVALISLLPILLPMLAPAASRTHLLPHFVAGQIFRYSIQTKIETSGAAVGPIVGAGGKNSLNQSVDAIVRLQVLSVAHTATGPSARIRVFYEKVVASSDGPAYDPDVAAMQKQYQALAGRSFEFTLSANGKVTRVVGLKSLLQDPSRAAVLNQWLAQLTFGASLPKEGIAVGEKWRSQEPLENVPLAGLSWKTRAQYLRNEPCPPITQVPSTAGGVPLTPAPAAPNTCAVILTRSAITGGSKPKERTPAVFRQNGLRTSGVWTGTAQALIAVSLRTGMVSSVTQTGSTHMDFTIMTILHRNRMRYAGDTHTQSEITLLSQSAMP